uniref:SMC hinge domain-containing protein n=1 Tax=Timema cristinae TaxID=61476 RepID=A0A7R9DD85_TIMCR|nr:unnamed protein product [Timema cristinae]
MQAARARLVMVKKEEAEVGAELQNCCRQVEEARSSMRATKSQGAVVDFLMAEKQSGRLPGIFGRLGDLGAIDQRYDVAVSTACGALDNIVVDTVTTAEHCIECLRRNDVGRATFIALEKQERWRPYCNQKIKTIALANIWADLLDEINMRNLILQSEDTTLEIEKENIAALRDEVNDRREMWPIYVESAKNIAAVLVVPAEFGIVGWYKTSSAFYFALRDTLVAQDLEQATRIAYGAERHRVVTLGGELIELSGVAKRSARLFRSRGGRYRMMVKGEGGQTKLLFTNTYFTCQDSVDSKI